LAAAESGQGCDVGPGEAQGFGFVGDAAETGNFRSLFNNI